MTVTADEQASFDEYAAVEAPVRVHLECAASGDGATMRTVWMDHATIVGSFDGQAATLTVDDFCARVTELGPAPEVQARIASIDISGNCARVRLESANLRGFRFTDFLLLVKRDGVWRISAKVFDAHSRA